MTAQTPALLTYETLSMTSREVAELTGKSHRHVVRDLANMVAELRGDGQTFGETPDGGVVDDSLGATQAPQAYLTQVCTAHAPQRGLQARGYEDTLGRAGQSEFVLDLEMLFLLLTGYSLQARHAVIKRWQELETQLAQMSSDLALINRLPDQDAQAFFDASIKVVHTLMGGLLSAKSKKAMLNAAKSRGACTPEVEGFILGAWEFQVKNAKDLIGKHDRSVYTLKRLAAQVHRIDTHAAQLRISSEAPALPDLYR